MIKLLQIIFLFLSVSLLFSQSERETRAVWVTTNFQLDWPPKSNDVELQKNALQNIFSNIDRKNLNTIYFQVRSNGTVFFDSGYEPYSPYLTGSTGTIPDYDPLEYAVKLAHKKGLELHAWVNVMRCYAGRNDDILDHPNHIINKHPEWVVKIKEGERVTYWLDPGLPEVRNYLIDLFNELVYKYDIDGIHLDFIRYPNQPFNDEFSYNIYGNGLDISDFRRENITKFLEALNINLREIKPTIKIGATPLGIYKNIEGAVGLEAYNDVYQNAPEWLKMGYIDYAVPQIYWDTKTNPKFEPLVKNWVKQSNDKNLVVGIAAYKDEVFSEIENQINIARKAGANGVAFFRYNHIKNKSFSSFKNKAFPSSFAWLKKAPPLPPENLRYTIKQNDGIKINLTWDIPFDITGNDSTAYYALYKIDSANAKIKAENLYEIFSSNKTSVTLGIENPKQFVYYFAIKAVDKLWNESEGSSNIVEIMVPSYDKLKSYSSPFDKPILITESIGNYKLLLFSEKTTSIKVIAEGNSENSLIMENVLQKGHNVFSITNDLSNFEKLKIMFGTNRLVELSL